MDNSEDSSSAGIHFGMDTIPDSASEDLPREVIQLANSQMEIDTDEQEVVPRMRREDSRLSSTSSSSSSSTNSSAGSSHGVDLTQEESTMDSFTSSNVHTVETEVSQIMEQSIQQDMDVHVLNKNTNSSDKPHSGKGNAEKDLAKLTDTKMNDERQSSSVTEKTDKDEGRPSSVIEKIDYESEPSCVIEKVEEDNGKLILEDVEVEEFQVTVRRDDIYGDECEIRSLVSSVEAGLKDLELMSLMDSSTKSLLDSQSMGTRSLTSSRENLTRIGKVARSLTASAENLNESIELLSATTSAEILHGDESAMDEEEEGSEYESESEDSEFDGSDGSYETYDTDSESESSDDSDNKMYSISKAELYNKRWSNNTVSKLEKSKVMTDKWLKDLEAPQISSQLDQKIMLELRLLNPYLTCGLCLGYLYEATTITECMHTFCKNCIVKHCMEVSLHCPVCNLMIHPTDPFVNIKFDRTLQDVVYKLLPNVAEKELQSIKEFYAQHPEAEARELNQKTPKAKGLSPKKGTQPEEDMQHTEISMVSLILEAEDDDSGAADNLEKKFVRVTGGATISNVSNFLKKKLKLQDSAEVDIFCCGDCIEERNLSLQSIRDKFYCGQDCLMLMQYKVRGVVT